MDPKKKDGYIELLLKILEKRNKNWKRDNERRRKHREAEHKCLI